MKIAVTANGADLDAPISPIFGRCPTYLFVDTETMQFEAVQNPAVSAPGGAGDGPARKNHPSRRAAPASSLLPYADTSSHSTPRCLMA